MATKAFVDTTILSDALLKVGADRKAARDALARYAETELPVYAIKEFKAGPLRGYVWLHNKFASEGSYSLAVAALQVMSRTLQRNLTSTALQALAGVAKVITTAKLATIQGSSARRMTHDRLEAEAARLELKAIILKAWRKRRSMTTRVVNPLTCYAEVDPYDERGLLALDPTTCTLSPSCCLAPAFVARKADLIALKSAVQAQPPSREATRRYQALRALERTSSRIFPPSSCRSLGDAVFAFFAPKGAAILTTNIKDHAPLAAALGKTVAKP